MTARRRFLMYEGTKSIVSQIETPDRVKLMPSCMHENGKVLVLVSATRAPCGVEMFARGLLKSFSSIGVENCSFALAGRLSETLALWSALAGAGALVVNLPVVAWKRALFMPALSLFFARLRRAQTIVVLHEWADMDWRRRIVIALYLLMAQTILFSSPSIRRQFTGSPIGWLPFKTGLVPIPPNIARPSALTSTPLTERLAEEKAKGRLILGHFGSIYPRKRSTFVLDIAAELRRLQIEVFVVFIGSFIRGSDCIESEFHARASALGLNGDILLTGYVETDAEIFALFDSVDAFVYSFAEGLSSRRGSILACLQSGRRVLVNAPATLDEFDHHPTFRNAMARTNLLVLSPQADAAEFADAIKALERSRAPEPLEFFDSSWRDAAVAIRAAIALRPGALEVAQSSKSDPAMSRSQPRSETSSLPSP